MSKKIQRTLNSIGSFIWAIVGFIITLGGLFYIFKKDKDTQDLLDQDGDLEDQSDDIQDQIDKLKDEMDNIDTGDMTDEDVADYFNKD